LLGVFLGLAPGMLAQWGVHVGVVEQGTGFGGAGRR
jgi:hypothetical protein